MDQNSQYNGNSYPYPDEAGNRQLVSPHPVVVNQLEHKKDGLAVSILFCWCLVIPLILSLIGVITGIISLARTGQHTGLALAGVILSAIGLVIGVAILLLLLMVTF